LPQNYQSSGATAEMGISLSLEKLEEAHAQLTGGCYSP